MRNRVIFTGANAAYMDLFCHMFYPTLRHFGRYRGDVKVVLLGPIDPKTRIRLRQANLAIEADTRKVDLSHVWKFEYAEHLQRKYEEVYYYDCDVWFQSDIHSMFALARPGKMMVCEEFTTYDPDCFYRGRGFNETSLTTLADWLPEGHRETVLNGFSRRRVINSGFFGGRQLGEVYEAIVHFCRGWPQTGFGFDQTIVNLWDFYFPETVRRIPERYALALCRPPKGMRTCDSSRMMLGSKPVVALHANRQRSPADKLREPRFVRLMKAHPECRQGVNPLR